MSAYLLCVFFRIFNPPDIVYALYLLKYIEKSLVLLAVTTGRSHCSYPVSSLATLRGSPSCTLDLALVCAKSSG